MKKSGVYKITNTINNKIYIGSSKDLDIRKSEHFTDLKFNRHVNKHLQASYNKYGRENFTHEVIEYCDVNLLIEKEQYYLDTLNPDYNILKKAYSPLGVKRTEEFKLHLSNLMTGRKRPSFSEEWKKNMGIVRKGKPKSEEWKKKVSVWMKGKQNCLGRILSEETRNKIGAGNSKPIIQYSLQGEFIKEWKSITDAILTLNIKSNHIGACCNGKRKKSFGFKWKFKENV
jgi:group I intron endonuclease